MRRLLAQLLEPAELGFGRVDVVGGGHGLSVPRET
jgi:hypothetical protein